MCEHKTITPDSAWGSYNVQKQNVNITDVMRFAVVEGDGRGGGDAGQDVGSPLKKMRMGSGLAHARDAGTIA